MHGRFIPIIWKAVKFSGIILLLWTIVGIVSIAGSLSYVKLFHKESGGETKYLQTTAYPSPRHMMSHFLALCLFCVIRRYFVLLFTGSLFYEKFLIIFWSICLYMNFGQTVTTAKNLLKWYFKDIFLCAKFLTNIWTNTLSIKYLQ